MFLCPSVICTCTMSFVVWYSIVPFQCRKVWNVIFRILGLLSLTARAFRCVVNSVLIVSLRGLNNVSYFVRGSFGRFTSIVISLSLIGKIRALLPFSGVTDSVLRCVSRSVDVSCVSSPILMPVSFNTCSIAAVFVLQCAIKRSISSSVGMNGSFSTAVYRGGFHVFPKNFR